MRRRLQLYRLASSGAGARPIFDAQSAPGGVVGSPYSYTFTASGGATFALGTGSLPTGLTLSSAGVLSGTPTAAATYPFTVIASNAAGSTESAAQSVVIAAAGGSGSIALTWEAPVFKADGVTASDHTGFQVLYGTASGVYGSPITVPGGASATSYSITGLAVGTTYYVRINALDAAGNASPFVPEVSGVAA